MRRLVPGFKYRGREDCLAWLGRRMAGSPRLGAFVRAGDAGPGAVVVPVPLSRSSRRLRGYNQAARLAQAYADSLGGTCDPRSLRRRRHDGPQAGSSRGVRLRQVRAAFGACGDRVHGRSVVLVDDVLSTGATADAASRALLRAGAVRVDVVTLAN